MKVIELTRGKVTIVDDEDFDYLAQWRWSCGNNGYARRGGYINGKKKTLSMSREIMGDPKGLIVDHINGHILDNRRSNLRIVTVAQSNINKGCQKRNQFGAKGVHWCKTTRKYQAMIGFNKKAHYLGQFLTLQEAKSAYDKACIELHGAFARLN